jgi:hypothetical protein
MKYLHEHPAFGRLLEATVAAVTAANPVFERLYLRADPSLVYRPSDLAERVRKSSAKMYARLNREFCLSSRYLPHQGDRECARRRRQLALHY